jgi:hypothetical protein
VESDRLLDGRQVEVEASRVDGKELGKESVSIASEGLEGHWEKGSRETHRGREDEMIGNESNLHRNDANIYIQLNIERERNPVVVVVWREGEATRQKGRRLHMCDIRAATFLSKLHQ